MKSVRGENKKRGGMGKEKEQEIISSKIWEGEAREREREQGGRRERDREGEIGKKRKEMERNWEKIC